MLRELLNVFGNLRLYGVNEKLNDAGVSDILKVHRIF